MPRLHPCALALCTLFASSSSHAGGLWLNEFGDFSGGRASAGSQAGVDDASALIHNPASITRLEGRQLQLNAGILIPEVEFDIESTGPFYGEGNGGQAGLNAPLAASYYVHDANSERWRFGIYMAGLAGSGLEYDDDWVGRFQVTDSELLVMALTPTVALQVNDKLSLGMGLQYYYASIDMGLAAPTPANPAAQGKVTIDGTDTGFGFTLGALYEFSPDTRLGINYQSEIAPDFGGDLSVSPADISVDSDLELTMGQLVRIGLHHQLTPQLGLDLTVGWDDWSALDNVLVSTENGSSGLEKNWRDTYHYAAGLQYQATKNWRATAGIAYDTNPVDTRDRTADLPVDRQLRYAAGMEHRNDSGLALGGYLIYMDLGSAKIDAGRWRGEYGDNSVLGVSLYANWTF